MSKPPKFTELESALFHEILVARQRIYAVGRPTPLDQIKLPDGTQLFLKREDLAPVHAYKWRGAFNKMAKLSPEEKRRGVIAASAGNHAQGIALGASKLGVPATIVMPETTPRMKQEAVARHGGDMVKVVLKGDSYNDAYTHALKIRDAEQLVMVHAFDDIDVMGGQGTIGDELVMSGEGPFDVAFLQIGGGGMAAGVATWLRRFNPGIEIVGVEGEHQASMKLAVERGTPTDLDQLDVFCDGTAVRRAGELTSVLCAELIDRFVTVTNPEVCSAIQFLWEKRRVVPEPAGAMGLAAWMKERRRHAGKKVISIICGANMDFARLAWIVRHAGVGSLSRKYFRFEIAERNGTLFKLLSSIRSLANIVEFQYGKTDANTAFPVIAFDVSEDSLEQLKSAWTTDGIPFEDITGEDDTEFRVIRYDASLFRNPHFIRVEFPERAGALSDFLGDIHTYAGICYFNYQYTGERVGRALLGFEFENEKDRARFIEHVKSGTHSLRTVEKVSDSVLKRMV